MTTALRRALPAIVVLVLPPLLVLWWLASLTNAPVVPPRDDGVAVSAALGGQAMDGYARALTPRPFDFPTDHGPHPDFRNEWWYLTGNLNTPDGRAFGYQFTIFRIALSPDDPTDDSAWRTRQLYMGHLALTDMEGNIHHAVQRLARGGDLGLAGAQARPFRVWLEDWTLEGAEDQAFFPLRLRAGDTSFALDLLMTTDKPAVLQGDRGLSPKGSEPGNASYYYSYTRLITAGTVTVDGTAHPVRGQSWLDREWSTSALGAEQTGWDWFALQLFDGRDLMLYRIRHIDGGMDRHSKGVLVSPDGEVTHLGARDFTLEPSRWWTSPTTGNRYPMQWALRIPGQGLTLQVAARLPDQEMDLAVQYWEGSVAVDGDVGGVGYLEMTRY